MGPLTANDIKDTGEIANLYQKYLIYQGFTFNLNFSSFTGGSDRYLIRSDFNVKESRAVSAKASSTRLPTYAELLPST